MKIHTQSEGTQQIVKIFIGKQQMRSDYMVVYIWSFEGNSKKGVKIN